MLVRRVSCCLRQEFPPVHSRGLFQRSGPGSDTNLVDLRRGACGHHPAQCSGDLPETHENRASDPCAVFVSGAAKSAEPALSRKNFAITLSEFAGGDHRHFFKLIFEAIPFFRALAGSCVWVTPAGRTP
jgi:hypothetical protein